MENNMTGISHYFQQHKHITSLTCNCDTIKLLNLVIHVEPRDFSNKRPLYIKYVLLCKILQMKTNYI